MGGRHGINKKRISMVPDWSKTTTLVTELFLYQIRSPHRVFLVPVVDIQNSGTQHNLRNEDSETKTQEQCLKA